MAENDLPMIGPNLVRSLQPIAEEIEHAVESVRTELKHEQNIDSAFRKVESRSDIGPEKTPDGTVKRFAPTETQWRLAVPQSLAQAYESSMLTISTLALTGLKRKQ